MTASRSARSVVYISDLEQRLSGGGSYAVNWHAFAQLSKRFKTGYAGPLVPRPPLIESFVSKLRRRILHRPGRFAYFSPATLEGNAAMASRYFDGADAVVFRSATRWCHCRPTVPYFVYLDVVFHTFFHNTFDQRDFDAGDLDRIGREEAAFLEGASAVFFESQWGLDKARAAYSLRGGHYSAPGRGGVIEPPAADTWDGSSRELVSMAFDFRQKGGDLTMEAYRLLKPRYPALSWHIVGAPPEGDWQSIGGIQYEGKLSPDIPAERERLRQLLSDAFLLVHPTREDTSPLVLTEAAYFGCPSVSVNAFAIPELVEDGATGVLIERPVTGGAIADAVAALLDDEVAYREMRLRARAASLKDHSWNRIGAAICDRIDETFA